VGDVDGGTRRRNRDFGGGGGGSSGGGGGSNLPLPSSGSMARAGEDDGKPLQQIEEK
jgi:hypothetical protein